MQKNVQTAVFPLSVKKITPAGALADQRYLQRLTYDDCAKTVYNYNIEKNCSEFRTFARKNFPILKL